MRRPGGPRKAPSSSSLEMSEPVKTQMDWMTAVRVWAREQAASAPPLSAEAARVVCGALTRGVQTLSPSPTKSIERHIVIKSEPEGSRQAS